MLTPMKLDDLRRELADTRVLSVYLDTHVTDPAMRHAWRPALITALRAARARITDGAERVRFDRAAALLRDFSPPPGGVWGAPGWVIFASADEVHHVADLPVRPTPLAAWRDGPVVAPYLRALKQHRPVIVALVDSRSARLHRYALGRLESLEVLSVPSTELAGAGYSGATARAASYPAPRGAVGTETAHRRRLAEFERLAASLGERLGQLAGDEGWVLIGGTTAWAHQAGAALPRRLEGRALVSTTLDHDAADVVIARAARRAASELRAAHGRRRAHVPAPVRAVW